MRKSYLFCAATILFFSANLFAQSLPVDPRRDWRVLETNHFEIIYDAEQKELAQHFANEAERAYRLLDPLLKPGPMRKIPLALADITDSSNGAASPVPRSEIEIYPVLPSVTDPTSEYADWDREVVQHELTHIINFEPTFGAMDVLRWIFGSIVKPDSYLPRWYLEGLAVEMESRLTPVGRGRSHYYSGFVRSLVEDDKWGTETIDRIGATEIPTWPRGQRPYTFGYFLVHELSELKNQTGSKDNIYGLLNDRYGGRVPWLIDAPVENFFGLDYAGLLTNMYQRLQKQASQEIEALHATKKPVPTNQNGYFNFGAQISPDKLKLAAVVQDYDDYSGIRVWTRKTPQDPFVLEKDSPPPVINNKDIHQLSWRKDSQHLVYDHSDFYQHYNIYDDLYELDTNTGKETRLTKGLRAREPAVLPAQSIVFIEAKPDRTVLMLADRNGENIQTLLTPPFGERVSTPRPYRDGVIYSHRDRTGREWIEYISLKTKKPVPLTRAEKVGQMHVMPVADNMSDTGFFFAGSDTGIMNIYHSNGHDRPAAVTNIASYATSPEVDPTGSSIIYSHMTSEGFKLEMQKSDEKISAPLTVGPLYNYPTAESGPAPEVKAEDEHSYNGVKYLLPQYFIPFVYFVPNGAIFTASTSNADPLSHHQYSADIGYDTRANKPTEDFMYSNGTFPFAINFSVANDYTYLIGANLTEHFTYANLNTQHFLFPDSNKWTIGPDITYRQTDYAPFLFTEFGPGASLNYNGISPEKDFQISPESGQALSLGYNYFLPTWGNTSYQNINGIGSIYLSGKLLPKHHVITERLSAWISPPQQTILTGFQQGGGEYLGSLYQTNFLVRGYPVGEFLGSTLLTENFEYRFPISYQYSGYGTAPLFIDKWHGALVFDATTLDGGYYNSNFNPAPLIATKLGTFYTGAGAEIRADMQLFYGIPVTGRAGAYYGFNQSAFGGFSYYLGFGWIQ